MVWEATVETISAKSHNMAPRQQVCLPNRIPQDTGRPRLKERLHQVQTQQAEYNDDGHEAPMVPLESVGGTVAATPPREHTRVSRKVRCGLKHGNTLGPEMP